MLRIPPQMHAPAISRWRFLFRAFRLLCLGRIGLGMEAHTTSIGVEAKKQTSLGSKLAFESLGFRV